MEQSHRASSDEGVQNDERIAVGIDIGGTFTKVGVVRIQHVQTRIVAGTNIITGSFRSCEDFVNGIAQTVEVLRKEFPTLSAVGVGFPSSVRWQSGIVSRPPNIPWWDQQEYSVGPLLQQRLSLPVVVDNDANVAAFAECSIGYGCTYRSFLFVTLGTGVGGAIILDRKLYRGERGSAGEVGHIIIDANAQEGDPVYRAGILEAYVGRAAILRAAQAAIDHYGHSLLSEIESQLDVVHVAQAAQAGDPAACEVLLHTGRYFGIGLASALALLGLEHVIVGGGISALPEMFYTAARETLRKRALPVLAPHVTLQRSLLGNNAGVIGAAMLAIDTLA